MPPRCRLLVCALVILLFSTMSAWKNPRQSASLHAPVFSTHDWIAYNDGVCTL